MEDKFELLRKAGAIAGTARDYGYSLLQEGAVISEVLDKIEAKILDLGGGIAFPAQLSLNSVAAHTCADFGDDLKLKDGDLIKLDVGAHVEGFIGDTAISKSIGNYHDDLIKASKEALYSALNIVKTGVTLGDIGKTIQEVIESYGFSPIRNLTGHGIGQYKIHTSPSVHNFATGSNYELSFGQQIAIEPFATDGVGSVHNVGLPTIFSLVNPKKNVRSSITRSILKDVRGYGTLPFASRWLSKKYGVSKVKFAMNDLERSGIVIGHPALAEDNGGMVSQAEHTVIVNNDGCDIITRVGDY